MSAVSSYIAKAIKKPLPAKVVEKSKHHILDTLAAVISGSKLLPGVKAIAYAKSLGGNSEACIPGTRIVTSAVNAAFASGVCGHADETDDYHERSNTHPGCGIVSAALAMAERQRSSGTSLLRAVALGYDIGCRVPIALHPPTFRNAGHSNHSFGGVFGAAAAAGALAGLNAESVRYLLSYTSQQASGIRTFERDTEHMLKAFVFGGMTARNGVAAATMVASGFTGVEDEFTGARNRNFFSAYSPAAKPQEMTRGLGSDYEIMSACIKKWSVGSPVQPALDAVVTMAHEHKLKAADIEKLIVRIPDDSVIVDNSNMPDINLQHLVAVMLLDGKLTFVSTHDEPRMKNSKVLAMRKRITLVASAELVTENAARQAVVEITTRDGRKLTHRVTAVRGSFENPMTRTELAEKSLDLMAPVLGKQRALNAIDKIWNLEKVADVRSLRTVLTTK